MTPIKKHSILGVGVSAVNLPLAVQTIAGWVADRTPHYVCVTPAHSVMDGYHDARLREIFNAAGLTTPDGMPIVWILRSLGQKHVSRVYGPDLMQAVCAASVEHGWRHYFYGGAPGVAEQLSARLQAQSPGLQVAGLYCPPFRQLTPAEDEAVVSAINESGADIVWIGLSSPKQDYWMSAHLGRLSAPVMVGVGAAFDFLSGSKTQAPRWLQRSGFEWFFRFVNEPRRLWPRYKQYPLFVLLVILQLLGLRKYSL